MKNLVLIALLASLFTISIGHAQSAAPATGESAASQARSKPDSTLWVYGAGGIEGGWWGVNTGGGLGSRTGVGARYQWGRCGVVAEWNRQSITYYSPDPVSELNLYGAGLACRATQFGTKNKFWEGAHILTRVMLEYGSNRFDIYKRNNAYFYGGKTWGAGALVGADFMMPIFYGFWAFGGTGIELLSFKYHLPDNTDGIRESGGPTATFFIRLGLSFGFL